MERLVSEALDRARIKYATDEGGGNPCGLDFHLTDFDIHIEVKRFHSDRVADQMRRAENVIVAQGETAIRWLAELIGGLNSR